MDTSTEIDPRVLAAQRLFADDGKTVEVCMTIDLRSIRAMVEATGYNGHIDIEIFSAQNWWKREPSEVLRICLERHQTVV